MILIKTAIAKEKLDNGKYLKRPFANAMNDLQKINSSPIRMREFSIWDLFSGEVSISCCFFFNIVSDKFITHI